MLIHDRIYGDFEINEPVMLALISSPSFQRLKRIEQLGLPDEYYHIAGYKRFEHCIGVMHLLQTLGASIEEQVAGLLHDVSHTAFSHLVDWVVGQEDVEDFQDTNHEAFILRSELAQILRDHGYDPHRIADYHPFTLLERDAPDVCADRVDYALREMPVEATRAALPYLVNHAQEMVFKEKDAALQFARAYLGLQMNHWGAFEAVSRYRLTAHALKRALEVGHITLEDFWSDGQTIIEKLLQAGDPLYAKTFTILRNKSLKAFPRLAEPAHKKFRHVDPNVLSGGTCVRVSELEPAFANELEVARAENAKGVLPIDVVSALESME